MTRKNAVPGQKECSPSLSLRGSETTEAIPFLEAYVIWTLLGYLNGYDLDSIYITNIKEGNLILKRRFYLSKSGVLQGSIS